MRGLEYLAGVIRQLSERVETIPSFRWARITSNQPLRIKFDGPAEEPEVAVSALFGAAEVGDRVLAIMSARRVFVFSPSSRPNGDVMPTGSIMEYAGAAAPPGWLLCDGRQVRVSDYPQLYAVIGTRYGGSGGVFALPDHRGRVAVGLDPGVTHFNQLGKKGGEASHTLTISEMPRHRHNLVYWANGRDNEFARIDQVDTRYSGANRAGIALADRSDPFGRAWRIGDTGDNHAHNNLQPYLTVNFIIKT